VTVYLRMSISDRQMLEDMGWGQCPLPFPILHPVIVIEAYQPSSRGSRSDESHHKRTAAVTGTATESIVNCPETGAR
jgi:hypothetical protein